MASVSHELRAPVASLGLLVDNLRRGAIAEVDRQQEYLRLMARECRRLSQLIQNVLATGRWDRGGRELVHESLDLGKLVQETVEGFTSLTAENALPVLCSHALPPTFLKRRQGPRRSRLHGAFVAFNCVSSSEIRALSGAMALSIS